jgi:hypothetical protein
MRIFVLVLIAAAPYRGLFPSPPLFDRMPTYRTQGKHSLNFLSAQEFASNSLLVHEITRLILGR